MLLIRVLDPSRWRHCVAWNVANWLPILTFIGPCIVIYSYSKTNQMHHCLKFILFWSSTLHVYWWFFLPSSGVQDCTYSNRHMSNRCLTYVCCCMYSLEFLMMDGKTMRNIMSIIYCCLLASNQTAILLFDICLLLYVQSWTPDDGRKDHPKHYVNHILLSAC